MASNRRRYITKSLVQQHGETPGCSACLGVSSQHTTKCRERFERLINPNATDVIPAIPSAVEDPSPAGGGASVDQQHATQPDTSKHVRQTVGREMRCGGQSDVFVSKQSSHTHTPSSCRSQMSKWGQCRCRCQKMQWRSTRCLRSLLIRPTWKRFSMRQSLEPELGSHRCKSSECSNGNASPRNHPMKKSSGRRSQSQRRRGSVKNCGTTVRRWSVRT